MADNDARQETPKEHDTRLLGMVDNILSGKVKTYCLVMTLKDSGDLMYAYSGGTLEALGVIHGAQVEIESRWKEGL